MLPVKPFIYEKYVKCITLFAFTLHIYNSYWNNIMQPFILKKSQLVSTYVCTALIHSKAQSEIFYVYNITKIHHIWMYRILQIYKKKFHSTLNEKYKVQCSSMKRKKFRIFLYVAIFTYIQQQKLHTIFNAASIIHWWVYGLV